MKPGVFFFLIIFTNTSCLGQQKSIAEIKLAYRSAMCQSYCDYTFIVNKNFKEITRTPGKALPSPKLNANKDTIMLTKTDWDKITHSFILDSVKALPKVNGRPGCDDGAIDSLQVISEKDTVSIEFEGPNPPKAIKVLTRLITQETFKE